ncbi:hypothetical protein ACFQJC_11510 [Haloferax namakaokahaiae]|uniref:Uncharacterized protein n=1 Tax=Haloferax namakaokahaiae TaxID=1748331 RepID=A0ABD5ZH04_9EURY
MSWTEVRRDERIVEWERSDGHATIRVRRGPKGWHVRFDRLHQSPDGRGYDTVQCSDEESADETVAEWKAKYDVE